MTAMAVMISVIPKHSPMILRNGLGSVSGSRSCSMMLIFWPSCQYPDRIANFSIRDYGLRAIAVILRYVADEGTVKKSVIQRDN